MDTTAIAPIIQKAIQDALAQKRYPFGYAKKTGMGNKIASGSLYNSVQVVPKQRGDVTILEVLMDAYAQYVQSGRLPGKRGVPIDALEQWIKDRGLQGRDSKGRFSTRRSFAFGIQTNIKKYGIRPSNFLDVAFDNLLNDEQFLQLLGEETFEDLLNIIEGI